MSKGRGPKALARVQTTWPDSPDVTKSVTIEGGKLADKVGHLCVQGEQLAWFTREEIVTLRDQLTTWIEDGDNR